MIIGHGGNIKETAKRFGFDPSEIIDMSSNVNPLGPPAGLMEFLVEKMDAILSLPESDARGAVEAFADRYGIAPERVLGGNGTTQFIYAIPEVLKTRNALILGPTYSDYADACKMWEVPFAFAMAKDSDDFFHDWAEVEKKAKEADTVFICNPNNPTGKMVPSDRIKELVAKLPDVFFIIDESYLPFVPGGDSHSLVGEEMENLLVLNSMSKIFRIPGLRVGFLIASPEVIEKFYRYYLPWSANSLAQEAVKFLMERREQTENFIQKSRTFLENERKAFLKTMEKSDAIRVFDSQTSFLLAKLARVDSADAFEQMARNRFLIRDCRNFAGLSEQYVRVSLKTEDANRRAAEKLMAVAETGKAG